MLPKKIKEQLEVATRERLIESARRYIIIFTDEHSPLYKSEVITATKQKFNTISEKAIREIIKELISEEWFIEKATLIDARRPVLESINFQMRNGY